jgi:hypothetical protein
MSHLVLICSDQNISVHSIVWLRASQQKIWKIGGSEGFLLIWGGSVAQECWLDESKLHDLWIA